MSKQLEKIANDRRQLKAYRLGFRNGIKAAASFIGAWDLKNLRYRLDDMLLCKFNVTRRKHPRKLK